MAKKLIDILSDAAVVRDETNEKANTAERVGGVLVELANYLSAFAPVSNVTVEADGANVRLVLHLKNEDGTVSTRGVTLPAATTANAGVLTPELLKALNAADRSETTSRQAADAELLKRIIGKSTSSSAYTDPFKYLDNFASEKDENGTVTKHAILVMQDYLIDTLRHSDFHDSFPFIGHMRAHIEGVPIEMWTYVKAWNTGSTNGVFVQVVRTNFGLKNGVISSALTEAFHEYHRTVTVGMANGSVTDVTATAWKESTVTEELYRTISDNKNKLSDLEDKVEILKNSGYIYAGIAIPSTNPGVPDGPVFYIASQAGAYSNFGNTEIDNIGIFTWDGTSWTFEKLDFIVNDLTTGGKGRALSAEQGVVLKGMIDSSVHIGDDDKVTHNQPLLDLIGTEGVDYTVIENMKFSSWGGDIVAATGNYLILVTMKNSILSYRGLTISEYKGWWTADVKPSSSDPNVDEDGNDVTYTKGYYNSVAKNGVSVEKHYLLFDAGTDVTNFVMAFLSFIPEPIYSIKSLNGGIRIVPSNIDGVGDKTIQLLKHGIATKHNSIDTNCVFNGMNFSNISPFYLLIAEGSIYLQPIPIGAKNVLVRGLRSTGRFEYHRIFVLDENFTILANDNSFGQLVKNQYVSLENVTGAKYLAFNASGANVANAIDEVLVLYDVPKDYDDWLAYNNYFESEKPILDIPYETGGIKNCMTYANLISKESGYSFDFLCKNITERYVTFIFPDGVYDASADTLVQYDENDNVLKSESLYYADKTKFGEKNTTLMQIRLVEGCVKLKFRFSSIFELGILSLEELIARGNKVILSNRTVEWGNNWVKSINGIPLNINAYSPLKGKLICCMGDSITDIGSSSANGSWAWYIQRNYDCGVANYGRGSAHFCDVANTDPTAEADPGAMNTSTAPNNVVSTQVRWCIRELTADNITPDAIVLTGLTNDAFSPVNLGDIDTALASYPMTADEVHTDFYGAAVYMVSKLRTAWPQVKIFFATPPRSLSPTHMQSLVEYVDAMRNVAKALGCGVIDFFDESLVEYPKATYDASTDTWTHDNPMYNTNDLLHPSQLGVNIMGQLASAKLIEYLK